MNLRRKPVAQRFTYMNGLVGKTLTVTCELYGTKEDVTGQLLGTAEVWQDGNNTGVVIMRRVDNHRFFVASMARIIAVTTPERLPPSWTPPE